MEKNDILKFIAVNMKYLKSHFHIVKICLFGSFARGENTPNSDIDLIIELEERTPQIYELKRDLRNYFEKEFHCKVDIAREKYLKPYVKEQILREATYAK